MDSVEQRHLDMLVLHKVMIIKTESKENPRGQDGSWEITRTISLAAQARSTSDGACTVPSPTANAEVPFRTPTQSTDCSRSSSSSSAFPTSSVSLCPVLHGFWVVEDWRRDLLGELDRHLELFNQHRRLFTLGMRPRPPLRHSETYVFWIVSSPSCASKQGPQFVEPMHRTASQKKTSGPLLVGYHRPPESVLRHEP
ncbi:hypothetical protein BHE74_00030298 [Ensete ventricosum]|nr:hypothetical protein BHE74_00030298 [Ensete ventricosum]